MTRGQRISRTELIQECRDALSWAGADNHWQAVYFRRLAAEVVGLDNPVFVKLQPRVHGGAPPAWSRAYAVALGFLLRHRLALSAETIALEGFRAAPDAAEPAPPFPDVAGALSPRLPFPHRVAALLSLPPPPWTVLTILSPARAPRAALFESEETQSDVIVEEVIDGPLLA
jgi:hypothetical protein